MSKVYKKQVNNNLNVIEAARIRIRKIFQQYDHVSVWFSGGKDSTVVLNLTLEVARELKRLPLEAIFIDEEAIHPQTIDYVERVRQNPEVNLKWYCLQIKHRNACSTEEPFWYCWDEDKKDKWVRPMPENVLNDKDLPGFVKGMSVPESSLLMYGKELGRSIQLLGLRATESLRRYRAVSQKKEDNYINGPLKGLNCWMGYPIYDFNTLDVWKAAANEKWDYNRTYDLFTMAGMTLDDQRVCPPYGEEPLRGLWVYKVCFPEMWDKMLYRVKGVATAWRYSNTKLYGTFKMNKPEDITWKQYLEVVLLMYPEPIRGKIKSIINVLINTHKNKSKRLIPEETPDTVSGCSWKFLCKVAYKGDFKNRQGQAMQLNGTREIEKLKTTLKEEIIKFGKDTRF